MGAGPLERFAVEVGDKIAAICIKDTRGSDGKISVPWEDVGQQLAPLIKKMNFDDSEADLFTKTVFAEITIKVSDASKERAGNNIKPEVISTPEPTPTPFAETETKPQTARNRATGIGLGSTLAQCTQSWGKVLKVRGEENGPNGEIAYDFRSQGYGLEADCFKGRVWRIIYTRLDGTPFTPELIKAFLVRTVPGANWTEIDYDGITYLTDGTENSYGNVSQSSHEALQAALSCTVQAVSFAGHRECLHIISSRKDPPQ